MSRFSTVPGAPPAALGKLLYGGTMLAVILQQEPWKGVQLHLGNL